MDILSIFPPDTIIKGAIGDKWYYIEFETTAINAHDDITKVCEQHKEKTRSFYENGICGSPVTPASFWHMNDIIAVHPDFSDVSEQEREDKEYTGIHP